MKNLPSKISVFLVYYQLLCIESKDMLIYQQVDPNF